MGKKFRKLEHEIEKEYEDKGFGHNRAEYIAKATAGQIARKKKRMRI